jgi:dTDP-4-amino-4,6-dideoxygalactose transaminase
MSAADITDEEIALVNQVMQSGTLSCGPMLERFELEWAERLGTRFAVGVSSGTAGLHIALIAAGVEADDFVITSPYSFIASSNAVLYQQAIPIFVDIDPLTLNIDPANVVQALRDVNGGETSARRWLPRHGAVASGRRVKAVVPVHIFGQPAVMPPIVEAARQHGAAVIEDACEAVAAEHEGQRAGTFGAASVFGFFPNKPLTTGEGGIVATDDPEWAVLFRSLRNQGRDDRLGWLQHVRLGFNYRLDEMSAAVGLGQLRRLETLLGNRARVAAGYHARLNIPGVAPITVAASTTRMSWFVYVVRLAPEIDRDGVIATLAQDGIPSRPYFPPIHLQPFYRERFGFLEGDFPHAEAAGRSTLALPFHGRMSDDQIDVVVDRLAHAVERCRETSASHGTVGTPAC